MHVLLLFQSIGAVDTGDCTRLWGMSNTINNVKLYSMNLYMCENVPGEKEPKIPTFPSPSSISEIDNLSDLSDLLSKTENQNKNKSDVLNKTQSYINNMTNLTLLHNNNISNSNIHIVSPSPLQIYTPSSSNIIVPSPVPVSETVPSSILYTPSPTPVSTPAPTPYIVPSPQYIRPSPSSQQYINPSVSPTISPSPLTNNIVFSPSSSTDSKDKSDNYNGVEPSKDSTTAPTPPNNNFNESERKKENNDNSTEQENNDNTHVVVIIILSSIISGIFVFGIVAFFINRKGIKLSRTKPEIKEEVDLEIGEKNNKSDNNNTQNQEILQKPKSIQKPILNSQTEITGKKNVLKNRGGRGKRNLVKTKMKLKSVKEFGQRKTPEVESPAIKKQVTKNETVFSMKPKTQEKLKILEKNKSKITSNVENEKVEKN